MSDLDDRIQRLLGESAVPPARHEQDRYHQAFLASGESKGAEIVTVLKEQGVHLERFGYLSVGGSIGAEMLHVLRNTSIRHAVMLEYSDSAAAIAESEAKSLGPQKLVRVLRGDATQKIEECRRILVNWREEGRIQGLVCSIQAVLHELPTRSPQYEPQFVLGEALWDWDPCFFFGREPCSPQGWPSRVKLSVGDVGSERLEALANHIRAMLRMPGDVRRAGPRAVLLPKDIAVEVLFKLFYLDDYAHEIQERVTTIDPDKLAKTLEAILAPGEVRCQLLNSASFESKYREFRVLVRDLDESTQRPPLTFVRIFGKRVGAPEVASNATLPAKGFGGGAPNVQAHADRLLNLPLLPWSPRKSPSLRVLWPELLVDPQLTAHKGLSGTRRLTEWMASIGWRANIAFVGSPGSGKTTVLRRLFLQLAERIEEPSAPFPVLGHVEDYAEYVAEPFHAGISGRIEEARRSGKRIVHLVDGLDEVDGALVERFFRSLVSTLSPNETTWCSCRSEDFFGRIGGQAAYTQHFREVLELCPWDETDSREFVRLFSEKVGRPQLTERFAKLSDSAPQLSELAGNPFQLSLILYLLNHPEEIGEDVQNAYALYDAFYAHWVRRESHRGTSATGLEEVRLLHTRIAEALFDSRGLLGRRGILLDESMAPLVRADSAVSDLLRIDDDAQRVLGFRHDTLAEYLLAHRILGALAEGQERLEDVLLRTYTFEVNRFVREGIRRFDESGRERLLRSLSSRYQEYRSGPSAVGEAASDGQNVPLRIREQLLYYIGRIPSPKAPEVLRCAYRDEEHSLLVRIAALGAALQGDEEIEADYLGRLTPGSKWDKENRSVQLLYFGDADGDMYSFLDNDRQPWARTRTAILTRLAANSLRDHRLRWWDLRTFQLFALSRGELAGLTEAERKVIRDSGARVESSTAERRAGINQVIEDLVGAGRSGDEVGADGSTGDDG